MTATETVTEVMPDIDGQPVCEIVWEPPDGKAYQCSRPATWQALAHDEVHAHNYQRLLLCGHCMLIAKVKRDCSECEVPLITDLRKL